MGEEAAASSSWASALAQLETPSVPQRCEAIDHVTELLQQNDWVLPAGQGADVITALRDRLNDANWCACPAGVGGRMVVTAAERARVSRRSVSQKCLLLIGNLVAEPDTEV